MTTEEVMARLGKKTRDRVQLASEIKIERIPWASVGLTAQTGGLARGRTHLLYGPKSAGKSLLSMETVGQQQDNGLVSAIIDSEGTTDPTFITKLGVDPTQLIVTHDKSFLEAGKNVTEFLKAGVDILVIDSISTLVPDEFMDEEELKASDGQRQIGAFSKACKKLFRTIHYNNENTVVIVVSQVTMALGAMHASMTFEGGKAVEHGSSQIIRMTASAAEAQQLKGLTTINDTIIERPIGREVSLFIEKNKLGLASGTTKYDMYYGGDNVGIDKIKELVTLGTEFGVVRKAGAWVYYGEMQFNGAKKMSEALREDEKLFNEVRDKIIEASGVRTD